MSLSQKDTFKKTLTLITLRIFTTKSEVPSEWKSIVSLALSFTLDQNQMTDQKPQLEWLVVALNTATLGTICVNLCVRCLGAEAHSSKAHPALKNPSYISL